MNGSNFPLTDQRTLQQVLASLEADRSRTGGYRPADLARVMGDPVKGVGLAGGMPNAKSTNDFESLVDDPVRCVMGINGGT